MADRQQRPKFLRRRTAPHRARLGGGEAFALLRPPAYPFPFFRRQWPDSPGIWPLAAEKGEFGNKTHRLSAKAGLRRGELGGGLLFERRHCAASRITDAPSSSPEVSRLQLQSCRRDVGRMLGRARGSESQQRPRSRDLSRHAAIERVRQACANGARPSAVADVELAVEEDRADELSTHRMDPATDGHDP